MAYLGNQITTAAFIADQFSGNNSTTQYTMSAAPAGTTSVLVSISGVLQDPSTYAVNGLTLTFSAAPPTGTGNISVRYLGVPASGIVNTAYRTVTEFTATAGQTTFSVPSYTAGFINVYRNGARLGGDDFTATNGVSVVLAAGAQAGDLVVTESFYVSSVLNAIPATAGAVNSTFLADSSVLAAKIADSSVTQNKIANGAIVQSKLATGVAGTGPAFSAYMTTNQSLAGNTSTKIQLSSETFDTNNNYDTTNYRFTPTVAGYYMINGGAELAAVAATYSICQIYKNGSVFATGPNYPTSSSAGPKVAVTALIYMNGSTDYVELYAQCQGGTTIFGTGSTSFASTTFQGVLVRAA